MQRTRGGGKKHHTQNKKLGKGGTRARKHAKKFFSMGVLVP